MSVPRASCTAGIGLLFAAVTFGQCDETRLLADDTTAADRFGKAVAVHGAQAVVGANWKDEGTPRSGAAYVFEASAGAWVQTAKLVPPLPWELIQFGSAVAVSGDRVLVGAPGDVVGEYRRGAAYLFERSGAAWSEVARLTSPPENGFGAAVAIADGRLFVGVPWGFPHKVCIFEEVDGTWIEVADVREEVWLDLFGGAIAAEGERLVVGASDASRVHVFERRGVDWPETALLTVAAPGGMGGAVDLEGDRILAGAPFDDHVAYNAGAAYVFELSGGTWTEVAKLVASDGAALEGFGVSVALEGDFAYVGARRHDGGAPDTGAVYAYTFDGVQWTETEKLLGPDARAGAQFGNSLALDRGRLVVGAERHDGLGADAGAAFVVERARAIGTSYCSATPHSGGAPALLVARGCPSLAANRLELLAAPVPPHRFGYFLTSASQAFEPLTGSAGNLCLAAPLVRFDQEVLDSGAAGELRFTPDLPVLPGGTAIQPGETWNFQAWFRDAVPAPTSNLSTGLAVTFATPGAPAVQFPVTTLTVAEDATVVEFALTLSQPAAGVVLVPYSLSGTATDGADYRAVTPSPLVFPTGETRLTLAITIAGDVLPEADETIRIDLGVPSGATLGTAVQAELVLLDDD